MAEKKTGHIPVKKTKSERTKELLYHTAMEMLIARGFQATTIREICKQANVSVGTFYSYFDSKYAIVFEIIRKIDHYFVDEVQPRLEGRPTEEQIFQYFQEYANYMEQSNLDIVSVVYSVQNIWLTRYRPMHRVLTSILQAGQLSGQVTMAWTAEQLCNYLFTGVRGVVFHWCSANGGFSVEEHVRDYIGFLMKSIILPPAADEQVLGVSSDVAD